MEHRDIFEIDLLKLVKALIKKLWIVILVAAVMAGALFAYGEMTCEPSYRASVTMYIKGAAYTSSDAKTRIETCIQVLQLPANLEAVAETAGVAPNPGELSSMISGGPVGSSELFRITVDGKDQETVLNLANAVQQLLPEMVAPIHGEGAIDSIDNGVWVEEISAKSMKLAMIAAVLGGMLVCVVVIGKELYADWKATSRKYV